MTHYDDDEAPKPYEVPGLIEGRMVHYIAKVDSCKSKKPDEVKHVVAQIVRVWSKTSGCSNLKLNYDGANDKDLERYPDDWITSVDYDGSATKPHTWHYIEQA